MSIRRRLALCHCYARTIQTEHNPIRTQEQKQTYCEDWSLVKTTTFYEISNQSMGTRSRIRQKNTVPSSAPQHSTFPSGVIATWFTQPPSPKTSVMHDPSLTLNSSAIPPIDADAM